MPEMTKADLLADNAALRKRIAELEAALTAAHAQVTEGLERQTATSEILRVISSSPTDLQPVLDAVAERSARLCDAEDAAVIRLEATGCRVVASYGVISWPSDVVPLSRNTPPGRSIIDRRTLHVNDLAATLDEYPDSQAFVERFGTRTVLAAPLLREGESVGCIMIRRQGVRPFSEKQIALLETFADQAVIAIENVRLFTELQEKNRALTTAHAHVTEALNQQTATSEILKVISSSPTDVQPVFDTIARNAVTLCAAAFGGLHRLEGDSITLDAQHGVPADELAVVERDVFPLPISRESATGRSILDRTVVHIRDIREDPDYRAPRLQKMQSFRTILAVPMFREGIPIGALSLWRREVQPFSEREISLVQTFANQAVIAIENVRLFKELEARNRDLTTALEQQTATSEILRVISQSPTDAQPVFDTIVRHAVRLCGAEHGSVFRFDGELLHLAAAYNMSGAPLEQFQSSFPRPLAEAGGLRDVIGTGAVLRLDDVEQGSYFTSAARAMFRALGVRSTLSVPMSHHDRVVGAIALTDPEADAFTEAHVELLQTFADQAVIAIENVRLFTELQEKNRALTEALEQQTATAEILRVISSSPTEVQPVFDAVAESAARLCEAFDAAIFRRDGDRLRLVAHHGPIPIRSLLPLVRGTSNGRAVLDGQPVHVADMQTEVDEFPEGSNNARHMGHRTILSVPLLREGTAIGAITVRRTEVLPFSDKQIQLLKTFADQAVIAIENVRLFNELEARNRDLSEALDQQTATSEILGAISSSPTDVQPVFDIIAERSLRLCGGLFSSVYRFDGELLHMVAHYNYPQVVLERSRQLFPTRPGRHLFAARAILERSVVHVPDVTRDPDWEAQDVARAAGFKSVLAVPMVRGDDPIGAIVVWHTDIAPFSDKHTAVLETFADQAVIAIENARLFTELEARNRELTDSLARQTATSEVLRAISRAPTDAQPVFDTIAASALRLCGAAHSGVWLYDGGLVHLAALQDVHPEGGEAVRRVYPRPADESSTIGRAIQTRTVTQIPDVLQDEAYTLKPLAQTVGFRSWLAAPMLRDGEPIGVVGVGRPEPGPFPDTQIALLQTFADQAVIAVENVRLFKELQARTTELARSVDELTALGEVSRALSSTLNLERVLNTIVTRANELAGTGGCFIFEYDETAEVFRLRASSYADPQEVATLDPVGRSTPIPKGQGVVSRAAALREPVQIADIAEEGTYESPIRGPLLQAGYRALLTVPLLLEEHVIGALGVSRKTPGTFAPEVVRLLSTFASQSALAIQNARLFREIEEKSRELEAASRHKSEFLSNMSHELRTPLNAIIGFSEVLGERMFGELTEKQEEYLKDIMESGQHLLSLINDILDLSKIEAGRMELELTDFDLPQAIDNALTLIRERAGRRGIALHQSVDERLGEMRGDERKVKQVLLNLLSNALKFTAEGGQVEVLARVVDGMAEISVTDTGVGIAPADQEAVFEEFRQVGTADKKAEGTGLGLTLCRKFVELHGGRIWVKSQVGQGSTFTFTLPLGEVSRRH